jgi:hypothetical protein
MKKTKAQRNCDACVDLVSELRRAAGSTHRQPKLVVRHVSLPDDIDLRDLASALHGRGAASEEAALLVSNDAGTMPELPLRIPGQPCLLQITYAIERGADSATAGPGGRASIVSALIGGLEPADVAASPLWPPRIH